MRNPRMMLALALAGAGLLGPLHAPSAYADAGAPPPPSTDEAQIEIPRRIRYNYYSVVFPLYLQWLNGNDSPPDSMGAFVTFLLTQPINDSERWAYIHLYATTH